MAIRDLLWACPQCAAVRTLRPSRRGDACAACGTTYRRGRGSTIIAERVGGESVVRPAAAWVDRLPDAALLAELTGDGRWDERVEARFARSETTIHDGGDYLGRVEELGPEQTGVLRLRSDRLIFELDDGLPRAWPLERITAVQASSSTLQLKMRAEPVISFRFPAGSLRFWEVRLQQTLHRMYRREGRGEIVEFQPRVVAR